MDKKSLQNTIFEKIVWKAPVDRQERKPKGDLSKADEYLFRGKTFSLDNFLKMQGRDVKGSGNHKVCLGRSPASRLMREEEPETRPANSSSKIVQNSHDMKRTTQRISPRH